MEIIINDYDFWNMEAEKYWSPTKNQNLKEIVNKAIYSGDYVASEKIDGDWRMFIKDMNGQCHLRGRSESVNGGYADKIEWVPHIKEILDKVPNGTVFLGELFFYNKRGSRNVTTIMGCLKDKAIARQKKEKLSYYIFDCLAYDGKNLMSRPLDERIDILYFNTPIKWETGGKEGVYRSIYIHHPEDIEELIANVLDKGGEGVVLKLRDAPYEPGKRTTRKSIKVKKEIEEEIDCFLTGNYKPATWAYTGKEIDNWEYWFNIKSNLKIRGKLYTAFLNGEPLEPITKGAFYNWAGAVEIGIYKNNEVVPIGWISNVTEEVKKSIIEKPNEWKHKVAKVTAMMIESDTKALRHAKIMEWRSDKNWTECDGHEFE